MRQELSPKHPKEEIKINIKKLIKKDNNKELEKILEKKQIDEQARNLLQGILYKIEVSYKDYQKVKGLDKTEEKYVDELIANIKKKCNQIKVVKLSQKLADEELQEELKKNKYYIGEKEIVSYPIEEKILYAIEKKSNNKKILNNKYGEAATSVSDFINLGKNIDRIEVLRDFNGWSWTTIKTEIENIDANLIYQIMQILFGEEFLYNWCEDKDGIVDYFEVLLSDTEGFGKDTVENIKNLLIKIAIISKVKSNKEYAKKIAKKLEVLNKELEDYNDTQNYIEKIANHKKETMKKLKDIDKILGQPARLKAEFEKRNEELPLEKKIFNIKVLKQEFLLQKQKLLNEINEYNYLLNPANFVKEKEIRLEEKELLEVSKYTKKQKEDLLIQFIQIFLQCLNVKIKNTTEQEEIVKLIYKFRYFMCLPFNSQKDVKQIKKLEKEILKTEKILVQKAIKNKVISNIPFEIMRHVFETRIIILEELYYKIILEDEKYYVQIFDENIKEEKFEIKAIENMKINKKVKIFI